MMEKVVAFLGDLFSGLVAFLDMLSPWANACSIVGLLLSIWLMIRTGKIKKNVDNALEKNNKGINYINLRDDMLNGLKECSEYLIYEHSPEERLPCLQKLDGHLADFSTCYPHMTANIKQDIDALRSSCTRNGVNFSFIEISKPLNNIISVLKMEAMNYD